ncbi:hypothetical protein PT974_03731 [Cladobotryum mycophilum]|uniref:Inhibitor of growth protein N-terminal histone-binding domain-containing protein n=1 Tax=Cladobotryum mycophilum TaxID=491253 RepID=A0ABR0STS6_9HYPO
METTCTTPLGPESPTLALLSQSSSSSSSHCTDGTSTFSPCPLSPTPPESSSGPAPRETNPRAPNELPPGPSSPSCNTGTSATTTITDIVAHHDNNNNDDDDDDADGNDDEPATPHSLDGVPLGLARAVVNMQEYYTSELGQLATRLEAMTAQLSQTQEDNRELRRRLDVHLVVLQGAAEFMQRVKEGKYGDLVPDEVPDQVPEADPGAELVLARVFGGKCAGGEAEDGPLQRPVPVKEKREQQQRVGRAHSRTHHRKQEPPVTTVTPQPTRLENDLALPPTPLFDSDPIRSTGLRAPKRSKRTGPSSFARRRIKRRSTTRSSQSLHNRDNVMGDDAPLSVFDQAAGPEKRLSLQLGQTPPKSASPWWISTTPADNTEKKKKKNSYGTRGRSGGMSNQEYQPRITRRSRGWTAVNVQPVRILEEEDEEEEGEVEEEEVEKEDEEEDVIFDKDAGSDYQPDHDIPSADEEDNTFSHPLSPCIDSPLRHPQSLPPLPPLSSLPSLSSSHSSLSSLSLSPTRPTAQHQHQHNHNRPRYSTPRRTTTPRYASGPSPAPSASTAWAAPSSPSGTSTSTAQTETRPSKP